MAAAGPVHILGAGSIGLLFSEALVSRGVPCTLLLRSQAKIAALAALKGKVTVERPHLGGSSTHNVAAELAAQRRSGAGITDTPYTPIKRLIVTTKANHAVPALASVKHRLSQDSVVLLLTNGVLGVYLDAVQQLYPASSTSQHPAFLLGMTTHGAYRKDEFHVVHAGQGAFVAGAPPADLVAAAAAAVAEPEPSKMHSSCSTRHTDSSLSRSGRTVQAKYVTPQQQQQQSDMSQEQQLNVQDMLSILGSLDQLQPTTSLTPEELQQQLLLKLVINCCSNPMSGLLHCRNGGLPGNAHAEIVWRHVIAECKAVFGDKLPGSEQELLNQVSHVVQLNAMNYNSMLQDVINRVNTEIDYLNGFVVQQGAAVGVATPWNEMLATLVHAREAVPRNYLTTETK